MRTVVTTAATAALLLTLTACAGEGAQTALDPDGPSPSSAAPTHEAPTAVPPAPGEVRSRALATVMDAGTGDPELCLGPVAESYPPQCGGPAITNWDWAQQRGMFEQQGEVRWGTFAVTGTWDGTAFTLSEAIPGALHDPAPEEPQEVPEAAVALDEDELIAIAEEVGDLAGGSGAYVDQGHVFLDVVYDDGSIQEHLDATYGEDVVVVTSQLVDAT